MTRAWTTFLAALLVAAGCKGTVPKPGAELRGPGPLAVFDGVVLHGNGTLRPYLAIGNERGGELRLVDTTDDDVVVSPGLVFPLSVPVAGRPRFVVAADLNDGARPDALVVVSAGSSTVELVDTWTGDPAVVQSIDLGAGAELLAVAAAPRPDGSGGAAVGVARFLVSISGGRLAVLEATRPDPALDELALALVTPAPYLDLGFDAGSLAQGGAPGFFAYAATRDALPGPVLGVARIDLPASLAGWSVQPIDARTPTELVAVARIDRWNPATDAFDGGAVDRVVAVPTAGGCGEGKPIRCGLLAVDVDPATGSGGLAAKPASVPDTDPWLQPIPIPGAITALVAAGRPAGATLPVASTAGLVGTTGVAFLASSDGRLYPVDVARWALVSNTSAVTGAGRARAVGATPVPGASSAIGLWSLDGATLSAAPADLPARVRVTPGFTPDDTFTLEWQGVLPALGGRAAVLGRDGTGPWLGVQLGLGGSARSVAHLGALGLLAGDVVELSGVGACPAEELVVASVDGAVADAPGGAIRFVTPPTCAGSALAVGESTPAVATARAKELVLSGATSGLVGRPAVDLVGPVDTIVETDFPGARLFYVTEGCPAGSECAATWQSAPYGGASALTFPFPTGPRIGLAPGLVDQDGLPTTVPPSRGTALRITTASGQSPSVRYPVIGGAASASTLPSGLALTDSGIAGVGPELFASWTDGVVTRASVASPPRSMTVYR